MRPLVAATVTYEDLKQFFKGTWRATTRDDGTFEARGNIFYVELAPKGASFAVQIHSYEDESDKDDAVTDDPMRFIVDFLKTGTAGDEALQKMARALQPAYRDQYVPPVVIANLLRAWALDVQDGSMGPGTLARLVRHASVLPDMYESIPILASMVRLAGRLEVEVEEMNQLADKMKEKGWRTKPGKNEHGMPELTVDVAGVYEAKIEVDHMTWQYSMEVHDHPDTKIEGVTDDPIEVYQQFRRSEPVRSAREDLVQSQQEKAESAKEEGTVAPKKKKPPEGSGSPFGGYESGGPS